jgi:hypothetical protein
MLRIGDRDLKTGMYWVIGEAGEVLGLGKKEFNEVVTAGDKVIGQLRADGIWVLVGRDGASASFAQRGEAARPATHDEEPIYRQLDVFNSPEEEGGDYTQLRISITNQNISFGDYLPGAAPLLAAPVHCDIQINNLPLLTFNYPGMAEVPTPVLFSGSNPCAWVWGEREPSALFPWRRVVLVVDLLRARSGGFGGTKANPLSIEIFHRIESGELAYYPPVPLSGSGNPRRAAPTSIWRVGFARKSDGRYINFPQQNRAAEYLDILAGNSQWIWHSGLPSKLGRPPQAHARSSFLFQEGVDDMWHVPGDTAATEVSRFLVKWPTYTIDSLAPSSIPSGRGFLVDYRSPNGYMTPEDSELYRVIGLPFPNFGTPPARTLRSIKLPRPKPKVKAPPDPAFAYNYPRRYPEYHSFPTP